jgi:hypothetical protein
LGVYRNFLRQIYLGISLGIDFTKFLGILQRFQREVQNSEDVQESLAGSTL